MVEEVAGVVEALLGRVVVEVDGALEEQEGSMIIQPNSGAEVLSLVPIDAAGADRIGALIPTAAGEDGEPWDISEETELDGGDTEEESDTESEAAAPKPERVGWATYIGPPP